MSRVISLAAGVSLSVLFSTAAVADNGEEAVTAILKPDPDLYRHRPWAEQHREAKGNITRSVQCSLPAYLRDPDNQC